LGDMDMDSGRNGLVRGHGLAWELTSETVTGLSRYTFPLQSVWQSTCWNDKHSTGSTSHDMPERISRDPAPLKNSWGGGCARLPLKRVSCGRYLSTATGARIYVDQVGTVIAWQTMLACSCTGHLDGSQHGDTETLRVACMPISPETSELLCSDLTRQKVRARLSRYRSSPDRWPWCDPI
jgi:hypothetical protein